MTKFQKIERVLGGVKFAVVVILLFTLAMIVGTFFESWYGTEYANRTIYKSWWFMAIQFCMFLSVFFAMSIRMPYKKRLTGFYIVHIGLILVFMGSFITYIAGIDGQMTLAPNNPTRTVTLDDDMLYMSFENSNKLVTLEMPKVASGIELNQEYEGIKIKRFIPYADDEMIWSETRDKVIESYHSSEYLIANDNIAQKFTMSTHPEAIDFPATTQLGPLKIHYLPVALSNCFDNKSSHGLIVWNAKTEKCFIPKDQSLQKTSTDKRFIVIEDQGKIHTFFPDFSPWPVDEKFEMIPNSDVRIFSKNLFEEGANLFLFGKTVSYFEDEVWVKKSIDEHTKVDLPWMGFGLKLLKYSESLVPEMIPREVRPIQANNELVKGKVRALEIEVAGSTYWIKNTTPISLRIGGEKINFELAKKSLKVPFEIYLQQFKMDTDPGTSNPASFESFIGLFTGTDYQKHHIFMNNPLKFSRFTFYQASYFQIDEETYGSVLSVNFDPGRWLKYLGSLFVVLGAFIHFVLKRKNTQRPSTGRVVLEGAPA